MVKFRNWSNRNLKGVSCDLRFKKYIVIAIVFFIIGYGVSYFVRRGEVRNYQNAANTVKQRIKLTEGKLQESLATAERIKADLDTVNRTIKNIRRENDELRTIIGRLGKSSAELTTGITNIIDTITGSKDSVDRSAAILREIQENGGNKN
jgi:peptidoglycan hydrolase CwlO-like protein